MNYLNINGNQKTENCNSVYKADEKSILQEIEVLIKEDFVLKSCKIEDNALCFQLANGQKFSLTAQETA